MATAEFRQNPLHDIAHIGLRTAVGVIFIVHSMGKFEPGFGGFLGNMGIPAEMAVPIGLAELIPGILLIVGVLNRISASLLAIIMLGAIFVIKKAACFAGCEGGNTEFDILLLAASLVIVVAGPGRISVAHAIKRIPRFLH